MQVINKGEANENIFERNQLLIGLIQHFPNKPAGENENIFRMKEALELLNHDVIILPIQGIEISKKVMLDSDACDLVFDIHFMVPRFTLSKTVGAVWTPIEYMWGWGIANVWQNQLSHSALVSTGDNKVFSIIKEWRSEVASSAISELPLNHTVPSSWFKPVKEYDPKNQLKIFYSGINWDKLTGKPGRHNDVLKMLDDGNVTEIYGPNELYGIYPWQGFKTYKGEIPFDGKSILDIANQAGIYLVWNGEGHVQDGIMSNRLFEALAADCIIIADSHPFTIEFLGDLAFYVDPLSDPAQVFEEINSILDYISQNPQDINDRKIRQRDILRKHFSLDDQLANILSAANVEIKNASADTLILVAGSVAEFRIQNSWIHTDQAIFEYNKQSTNTFTVLELIQSINSYPEYNNFLFFDENTQLTHDFFEMLENQIKMHKGEVTALTFPGIILDESAEKITFRMENSEYSSNILFNGLCFINWIKDETIKQMGKVSILLEKIQHCQVVAWRSEALVLNKLTVFNERLNTIHTLDRAINSFQEGGKSSQAAINQIMRQNERQHLAESIAQLSRGERKRIVLSLTASMIASTKFKILLRRIHSKLRHG